MTIIEAIDQLNDALRRKRDRAKAMAEAAREAAARTARWAGGVPVGAAGLDFGELAPWERYDHWTPDTIWDRQKKRFISREQWQQQVNEYWARQRRQLQGGD